MDDERLNKKGNSNRDINGKLKYQGILISLLGVGYIFLQVWPSTMIEMIVSSVILVVILWVLPDIKGAILIIITLLLITALVIMVYFSVPLQEWSNALRINITLVALLLFVPLLGIPVKVGGYIESLRVVFSKRMNDPGSFYLGSKLLTHILGIIINIGAVSIVYSLTKASSITNSRLISNSINRGFVTSIYWSPYFSAMALILSNLPIQWASIVMYSLGATIFSMIVSILLEIKIIRSEGKPHQVRERNSLVNTQEMNEAKKKVAELFIMLSVIVGLVLLLEIILTLSMVMVICIVSAIFPLLWCVLSRKLSLYIQEFKKHIFFSIPRMKKEIVLFLVAGFFSGAFIRADLGRYLINLINDLFGGGSIGAAYFISFIIVVTAILGLHPIVLVTILVTSIDPELIGFSPEYFAVLLLTTWGISNTISPSTAVNNLLSNLLKVSLFKVSLEWNIKFVVIVFLFIPLYLELIGV